VPDSDSYFLLLVDDNPINLELLSRRLMKKNYWVVTADSGKKALDLLDKESFDLVLLDYMMPDLNGIDVLRQIRKKFTMAHLPVIMLTAKTENENLVEALTAGANDFIAKPIDFEVLIARVNSQLMHRTLERSLRKSESQYRELFDNASDLIFSFAPDGHFIYYNQSFIRNLGINESDIYEISFFDLISPAYKMQLNFFVESLLVEKQLNNFELCLLRPNGKEIYLEGNINTSWNKQKISAYRGIFHDISERKKTEGLKNAFVSMVSHELRTPLTSIRGSLSLALGEVLGPISPDIKELLDISYRNCDRLLFLINDILDIDKIKAGMMEFHFEPLDLNVILAKALISNQSYAFQFGTQFHFEPLGAPAWVQADQERLLQVVANLLSNASKFSHPQARVEISVEEPSEGIYRVLVQDFGEGIPEEFHSQVFSKFAQADNSTTRSKGGSGLGLAISKEIIEKHGGELGFFSVLAQGSTFYFDLPALRRE
jgi:PAS domain S-box-containing protein